MYLRAMRLVSANNAGKGSDMCCTEWPFCALQCEEAALEEKFSTKPIECVRRYRIAQCLLQQLQSEAQSRRDRHVLQKYLQFLDIRLAVLSRNV